jgi:alpha-1,3-glucosyltransferase
MPPAIPVNLSLIHLQPAYFVYLLRSYCISPAGEIHLKNFLSLANAVIAVFVLSLGPFALMGQIPQLLSRLFPFTRGLNHAYWAPNVWALVTAVDRVLLKCKSFLDIPRTCISQTQFPDVKLTGSNIPLNEAGVASTSRGLVGDTIFAVIPNVKPIHTFIITIAFQLVGVL